MATTIVIYRVNDTDPSATSDPIPISGYTFRVIVRIALGTFVGTATAKLSLVNANGDPVTLSNHTLPIAGSGDFLLPRVTMASAIPADYASLLSAHLYDDNGPLCDPGGPVRIIAAHGEAPAKAGS